MKTTLKQLWAGELPLTQAFWIWLVGYGLAINIGFTLLGLVAYLLTKSPFAFVLLHFLPLPYNILAAAGTLRSTGRHSIAPWRATAAQVATVLIFIFYLLI